MGYTIQQKERKDPREAPAASEIKRTKPPNALNIELGKEAEIDRIKPSNAPEIKLANEAPNAAAEIDPT